MSQRVRWQVQFTGHETGNFLGYGTANKEIRDALFRAGYEHDENAKVAVHFCFPLIYEPQPQHTNVLFTMYENPYDERGLEEVFANAFRRADVIVTPSEFCREMFQKLTDKPVHLCPLGIDPQSFPYRQRQWDGRSPFVWLFCGAANRRKFTVLDEVWNELFAPGKELNGRAVLYMKTTGLVFNDECKAIMGDAYQTFSPPEGDVVVGDGIIMDNRKLPHARMRDVYWGAHGSIFLHCGEGWGMTGLEAMATGLPLVVSDYAGTKEYANVDNSFLVPTKWTEIKVRARGMEEPDDYKGPWPDADIAQHQIGQVMRDYAAASEVARTGAEDARAFSWDAAGRRLAEIISGL